MRFWQAKPWWQKQQKITTIRQITKSKKNNIFQSSSQSYFEDGGGCRGLTFGSEGGGLEFRFPSFQSTYLRPASLSCLGGLADWREISLTHSKPCTAPPHSRSRPPRAASVHVGVIVWGGCVGGADPTTTNTPNFTRATISCWTSDPSSSGHPNLCHTVKITHLIRLSKIRKV